MYKLIVFIILLGLGCGAKDEFSIKEGILIKYRRQFCGRLKRDLKEQNIRAIFTEELQCWIRYPDNTDSYLKNEHYQDYSKTLGLIKKQAI